MKIKKSLLWAVVIVAVIAAGAGLLVTFLSVSTTPAEAAPCICPQIYAPVTCDNGRTYPNQCVADCRHARNCVPSGAF